MVKKQVPCVFKGAFVREQVDPRIKAAWGPTSIPWGDLRRTWKEQHCLRVNPTGYPEDCPFPEEECAMAFLQAALIVKDAARPGAMFRVVAANKGAERADHRPLARDRVPAGRQGDLGERPTPRQSGPVRPVGPSQSPRDDLSGRAARPTSIGALLGSMDLGARQGRPADGEEGHRR